MGFLDFFKKDKQNMDYVSTSEVEIDSSLGILNITNDNFLDTESREALAKYRHNLKKLYEELQVKQEMTKFALIRDDDYYPYDDKWIVNSKDTAIVRKSTALSLALRERYALEQAGLYKKISGIPIPVKKEELKAALNKTSMDMFNIAIPEYFRSTKHFTVSTPLSVTGDYNSVADNRNFVIIDTMDNFMASPYTYSIAAHDAYLDVCHEPFKVSDQAIVLIKKDKYEKLKKDEKLIEELKKKRVVIYQGEEYLAINMLLTELGIMPLKVGNIYLEDDDNLIMKLSEEALRKMAKDKKIFYDQGHAGDIGGHFSNYYDCINNDYALSLQEFVEFLQNKFPEYAKYISVKVITDEMLSNRLIDIVGVDKLMVAINDYNLLCRKNIEVRRDKYLKDRENVTKEVSDIFVKTLNMIKDFYRIKNNSNYTNNELDELEEKIRLFFQGSTVKEQLENAKMIMNIFNRKKELDEMINTDKCLEDEKINISSI